MIHPLVLQRVGEEMKSASVHRILARPGEALRPGSPLLELRVDLGAAKAQDCPPIFFLRLLSTERAHLRAWSAAEGETLEVGARLGLATTAADEAVDGAAGRALRTTSVMIQVDPLAV